MGNILTAEEIENTFKRLPNTRTTPISHILKS